MKSILKQKQRDAYTAYGKGKKLSFKKKYTKIQDPTLNFDILLQVKQLAYNLGNSKQGIVLPFFFTAKWADLTACPAM